VCHAPSTVAPGHLWLEGATVDLAQQDFDLGSAVGRAGIEVEIHSLQFRMLESQRLSQAP
jgi:hypothetical protein